MVNLPGSLRILAIAMGSGRRTHLLSFTLRRAQPAVPMPRLVDISSSSGADSSIQRIFGLTQINSVSLHRHVNASFRFDRLDQGFAEFL